MQTFAEKPKAPQQTPSAMATTASGADFGQSRDVNSILHLQRTIGNQAVLRFLKGNVEEPNAVLTGTASPHFGHDFSRISVSPSKAGAIQTKPAISKQGAEHTLRAEADVVRRSAISDDIQTVWNATPTMDALLARLSQADVQAAENDTDIDTKINTLLAGRPNDLWLAQRIRQGRLGMTAGARPIQAHYIQGTTPRRALVIAGMHGSELQGIEVANMLLADLAVRQPMYTVILVPTLFPDDAARRHRGEYTNRNMPPSNQDLAAATAAGGRRGPVDALSRPILPENIMLLRLIESFSPERIISIHGTSRPGAGGVFYDPVRLTPAEMIFASITARAMTAMGVPVTESSIVAGMENRDRAPALAAAEQIDIATRGITGRDQRSMGRETERTVPTAELPGRLAHPSVAGNVGSTGAVDTAYWSGTSPPGVSLGQYASQRGISIFTVEPPLNLNLNDYRSSQATDPGVDAAERRVELQAYSDAIRTVLLGR